MNVYGENMNVYGESSESGFSGFKDWQDSKRRKLESAGCTPSHERDRVTPSALQKGGIRESSLT